jgi:hypothetical protein
LYCGNYGKLLLSGCTANPSVVARQPPDKRKIANVVISENA